jgi:hypothetical protein
LDCDIAGIPGRACAIDDVAVADYKVEWLARGGARKKEEDVKPLHLKGILA